ncbi:MAG: restriction endonuclease [Nitrososphaerales archaeon]
MSLEKGIGLELKIADLFKKSGYEVVHNVRKKGRSGAEHQIDVWAEYKAPLHTSTVIIEAKSYEANIDKDIVMKLVEIQQDLRVDRAILAVTSDFTPGAIQTAAQYPNIELWNREKLASVIGEVQLIDTSDAVEQVSAKTRSMVAPALSIEQVKSYAEKSADKRSKGGFLGRGKINEKVLAVEKFLYPYYDVEMSVTLISIERAGMFKKDAVTKTVKSRTGVDAVTGALINVDDKGINYGYSFLSQLNGDEIRLLYLASGYKTFAMQDALALGLSEGKTRKLVRGLVAKGILTQSKGKPVIYENRFGYPSNPPALVSVAEKHATQNALLEDRKIEVMIQPSSVTSAFNQYWDRCEVTSIHIVYYPYYAIVYERDNQTQRREFIDGMTGNRQEYLESVLSVDAFKK